MEGTSSNTLRKAVILLWIASIGMASYFYWFKPDFLREEMIFLFGSSLVFGYGIYFFLGSLRGFVLIPVTYFIVAGMLFFPPLPLYLLTMSGVLVSSATLYYFSDFLNLDVFFERKYPAQITKLKGLLEKNELLIVIGWSFFPFFPTDVICYVCGALRIDFKKFLFGVLIGEGIACAIYIFLGAHILSLFHFF